MDLLSLNKSSFFFCSGAMDSFARGLRNAAKLIDEKPLASLVAVSQHALG